MCYILQTSLITIYATFETVPETIFGIQQTFIGMLENTFNTYTIFFLLLFQKYIIAKIQAHLHSYLLLTKQLYYKYKKYKK